MPLESVQNSLAFLGYLPAASISGNDNDATARALLRFKRHAARPYRLTEDGRREDLAPQFQFSGNIDESLTEDTILELRRWIGRGWRLPLGCFKFVSLAEEGRPASQRLRWSHMREDAAPAWREAMKEASARGATLAEPYGDTLRLLGYAKKDGSSRRSFHFTGRAVDLNQGLAQGLRQRYFVAPEVSNERIYFRLLCRTVRQDGSQGRYYQAGELACWRALSGEVPLPSGWYVDLTDLLEAARFERVRAKEGWEHRDIRSEWWHYQFAVDKQPTFLDECELVGFSEQRLLATGYTRDEIDRDPG